MTLKKLGIAMDGKHELVLRPMDRSTQIKVGVYPSDHGEIYIITQNGTWITVKENGSANIDIAGVRK
jgi:hypothetical protein